MENEPLYIEAFNYPLEDERIAKYPLPERDHSKLLIYRHGQVSEDIFTALPDYLHLAYLPNANNIRLRLSAYDVDREKAAAPREKLAADPPRRGVKCGRQNQKIIGGSLQWQISLSSSKRSKV